MLFPNNNSLDQHNLGTKKFANEMHIFQPYNAHPHTTFQTPPSPYQFRLQHPVTIRPCRQISSSKEKQGAIKSVDLGNDTLKYQPISQQAQKQSIETSTATQTPQFSSHIFRNVKQSKSHANLTNFSSGSQSLIEKLKDFQSTQTKYKQQKVAQSLIKLRKEVEELKLFVRNEMGEKLKKMHEFYSEGNRKSVELVMVIVDRLERENRELRHRLESREGKQMQPQNNHICRNKCCVSDGISNKFTCINQDQTTSIIFQAQQHQNIISIYKNHHEIRNSQQLLSKPPISQAFSENNVRIGPSSQSFFQLDTNNTTLTTPLDQQKSHVQSILLVGDYLQIIQEEENDDDTYSINPWNKSNNHRQQNTFSSQSYASHQQSHQKGTSVSCFQDFLRQNYNYEGDNGRLKYVHKGHQAIQITQNKDALNQPNFPSNKKSEIQQTTYEEQEESMIVKKLLKLRKAQQKKHNQNQISQTISPVSIISQRNHQIRQCQNLNQSFNRKSDIQSQANQPFANISLDQFKTQSSHQISQALSILKEYNQQEAKESLLNENKINQKEGQKTKNCTHKISLVAARKNQQNKQNVPLEGSKNFTKAHQKIEQNNSVGNRFIYAKINTFFQP